MGVINNGCKTCDVITINAGKENVPRKDIKIIKSIKNIKVYENYISHNSFTDGDFFLNNLFVLRNKHGASTTWDLNSYTLSEGLPQILIVSTASFFLSFASYVSFSLSLSLSLSLRTSYVSFSLSFKILSSLLSLHILRYSQTLLADKTRFVLNFLDRAFRTARKFVRLATRIVFGLHSHILAVNSHRYYTTKRTTTVEHMLY